MQQAAGSVAALTDVGPDRDPLKVVEIKQLVKALGLPGDAMVRYV